MIYRSATGHFTIKGTAVSPYAVKRLVDEHGLTLDQVVEQMPNIAPDDVRMAYRFACDNPRWG